MALRHSVLGRDVLLVGSSFRVADSPGRTPDRVISTAGSLDGLGCPV